MEELIQSSLIVLFMLASIGVGVVFIWAVATSVFDGVQRRAFENMKKWDNEKSK